MRQPRVFISCSRADRPFAAKLSDYLRRAYDEVWFDENRYGGDVWWDEILWNIRACDLFIYLVSPEGIRAAYCQAEYAEAVRLRKQILPLLIRPVAAVPSVLLPLQPLDISQGINPESVEEVLSALKQRENRLLKIPQQPHSPEPTPMPLVEEETPPRRFKLRWAVPPAFIVLLLLWAMPRLIGSAPSPTPTGTRFVHTATTAPLPAVTVIVITPASTQPATQPATLQSTVQATQQATRTPVPATATNAATPTATASATPTSSPTDTATPTLTPTQPTSTSTVPPTVTRRAAATKAGG